MTKLIEKNITAEHCYNQWVFGLVYYNGEPHYITPNMEHPEYDDFQEGKYDYHLLFKPTEEQYIFLLEQSLIFRGKIAGEYDWHKFIETSNMVTETTEGIPVIATFTYFNDSREIKEIIYHDKEAELSSGGNSA